MNEYFEQFVGDSDLDDIEREYQEYLYRRECLSRTDDPLDIPGYIRVVQRWKDEYEKSWDEYLSRGGMGIPPIAAELEYLLCV